jgi:hypothetical protein
LVLEGRVARQLRQTIQTETMGRTEARRASQSAAKHLQQGLEVEQAAEVQPAEAQEIL